MATEKRTRGKRKMAKKANDAVVSIQLHGLKPLNESNLPIIDTTIKTFNSASRCAFKRFKQIGLKGMWKKVGRKNFWQIDKDAGSPIQGAIASVKYWLEANNYELDSTLTQNAVMEGFRNYMSFERQQSKWRTSKTSPSFGDMDARSRNKLTKEEFQLTRNGSMTVIGKARNGNPKFRFDVENSIVSFLYKRKKLGFSFLSNRFSRKSIEKLNDIARFMSEGKLPVTMTLTKTDNEKYNLTLTYSEKEFRELKKECPRLRSSIVSGIWVSDEVIHHQIVDASRNNKVLHAHTYKVEEFSGEKKFRDYLESRRLEHDWHIVNKLKERAKNKLLVGARKTLAKIFNISKSYGAKTVVLEKPTSKSKRSFNCSLIGFNKFSVQNGTGKSCFMTYSKFVQMVKSQCAKSGMEMSMVNGEFIQLKAILDSTSVSDAIGNACSEMLARQTRGYDPRLTDWRKYMSQDPSMLDWVGHLLHNKRSRQARGEIKVAFQTRAVEKAVRLIDKRQIRNASV